MEQTLRQATSIDHGEGGQSHLNSPSASEHRVAIDVARCWAASWQTFWGSVGVEPGASEASNPLKLSTRAANLQLDRQSEMGVSRLELQASLS